MSLKTISGADPLDIVEQTLKRLYGRIETPSATDATFFRVALKAMQQIRSGVQREAPAPVLAPTPAPEAPVSPLEGLSVRQVQEMVDAGELDAREALEHELAQESSRVTLVRWLEEYITAPVDQEEGQEEDQEEDQEGDE